MPRDPVSACIALGANLGDAPATLRWAIARIGALRGVALRRVSRLYRTAPVDAAGPDFVNAVVCVSTTLSAPDLMQVLHALEDDGGRERPYRHAPRTLDLDLLLYGDARIDSPSLTVPHPRMGSRAFVLVPLAEVAPEAVSAEALRRVSDQRIEVLPEGG